MANEKEMTGYPSIDKPWLQYYNDKDEKILVPQCSIYENLADCCKDYMDNIALEYLGEKITYLKLLDNIDKVANALI